MKGEGWRLPKLGPSAARESVGRQDSRDSATRDGHKDLSPEAPEGRREMWYVYFLELTNGDIYVGSTNDLRRRVASHQQGQVISTCRYLPAVLRSYVAVGTEPHARR